MSRSEYKRKTRKRAQQEGIEGSVEALYERSRGRLVRMAKSDNSSKGTPEWQKNVALATNTAGAAAGPAAVYMAVKQARSKKGGMPRAGVEAVEAKSKPTTRLGRAARATGKVVRNPKAIAAGGAVAIGAQVANTSGDVIAARFLAEDKKKGKVVNKSIEQSFISKSDAVVITGNGNSLVEKRQFDAEADRQRRLGLYTGLGAVGAAGFGAAAAKDVKFQGTNRAKGRLAAVKLKGQPWSKKRVGSKAGLAALAAASAAGGVGAYRRGISERNYPYN